MGLRDYFGKLFKPTVKPEVRELAAVSVSGRWSTYPSLGLTPGRLTGIFQEADQGLVQRQMELFEEMEEKDAHLASLLQTRKLAVLSLDYEVLPYAKTPEDENIAEAVGRWCTASPTWRRRFWTCWTRSAKGSPWRKWCGVWMGSGPDQRTPVDSAKEGNLCR